jgi:hypothetical protein
LCAGAGDTSLTQTSGQRLHTIGMANSGAAFTLVTEEL